jgi:hypothetical protein
MSVLSDSFGLQRFYVVEQQPRGMLIMVVALLLKRPG